MNRLSFLMAFILCCNLGFSQGVNLEEMKESKRIAYLKKKSKEVIMNYGPSYYRKNDSVPNIVAKNYNRNLRIERISRTIIGNKYRYDIDATYHDTLFVIQSYCDIENKSTKGIELEIGKTYPMSLIAEKMDLSDYDELDFGDLFFMWDKRKIMKINDRPLIFTSPNLCGKRYVAKVE